MKSTNNLLKKVHSKTSNRGFSFKLKSFNSNKVADTDSKFLKLRTYFVLSSQYGRISASEIEATRRVLRRLSNKRYEKIFVRICAFIPLTKKPIQSRMGRGKGSQSGVFICFVKPGKVLFEIQSRRRLSHQLLENIFLQAKNKMSIKTYLVNKQKCLFA